jgi:hypothetical protein
MIRTSRGRTTAILALSALLLLAMGGGSLALNLTRIRHSHQDLALYLARAFFRQLVLTRRWNAMHGGVYVPVTNQVQPNPYLADPLRDVVTTNGIPLTKINPSFMTRMLSELTAREEGVVFHMTSLRPLRPGNEPDAWERPNLVRFQEGAAETYELTGLDGPAPLFRYMAPLLTEASCLECHGTQGYREGEIRGGIRVDVPFAPFQAAQAAEQHGLVRIHLMFVFLGLGVIGVMGVVLMAAVRREEQAAGRVKKLEGFLPICAQCKKIRLEGADFRLQDSWVAVEEYVSDHSEAQFSHGLCPHCLSSLYPDLPSAGGKDSLPPPGEPSPPGSGRA